MRDTQANSCRDIINRNVLRSAACCIRFDASAGLCTGSATKFTLFVYIGGDITAKAATAGCATDNRNKGKARKTAGARVPKYSFGFGKMHSLL